MSNVHIKFLQAEMFPDLDLGRIFAEYGHMTTDGLASFIVENMEQMPRKKKSSTDETLVRFLIIYFYKCSYRISINYKSSVITKFCSLCILGKTRW